MTSASVGRIFRQKSRGVPEQSLQMVPSRVMDRENVRVGGRTADGFATITWWCLASMSLPKMYMCAYAALPKSARKKRTCCNFIAVAERGLSRTNGGITARVLKL